MFQSYRNQSTDLYLIYIEWFLYDGKVGSKLVKSKIKTKIKKNVSPQRHVIHRWCYTVSLLIADTIHHHWTFFRF